MTTTKKVADLFASAREGGAPSDADRARNRTEIAVKLASAAVAGLAVKAAAKTAGSSVLTGKCGASALVAKVAQLGLAAKIALATLVSGAALLAVTTHVTRGSSGSTLDLPSGSVFATDRPAKAERGEAPPHDHGAAVVPATHPASSPLAASPEVPVPAALASPAVPAMSEPHSRRVAPPSTASVATAPNVATVDPPATTIMPAAAALGEELALLRRGKSHLEQGDDASALADVAEYDRRFPQGTLREEARVVRVLALCTSGRADEGRALASSLRGSVAWERMRTACAIP